VQSRADNSVEDAAASDGRLPPMRAAVRDARAVRMANAEGPVYSAQMLKRAQRLIAPYRVTDGKSFRLKDVDPADTRGLDDEFKDEAKELLQKGVEMLGDLQEKLYAQDRWSVLLQFQAMDAAGKDGTIKHVMSGVNPQGCQVHAFKAPSSEELDHDFLWRTTCRLPERGRIGIFNRSYYEEVLVVRVHHNLLASAKLPPTLVTKGIWDERFEDIVAFERYLGRQGYAIRKFFLHVSRKEQKRRFLARLDEPAKNWKFSAADAREREFWDDYMDAYEDMIRHTATPDAPWFVVPADNKWFTRLVVAAAVVDALASLDLAFPKIDAAKRAELAEARALLTGGKPGRGGSRR
jgi:PPK2 family polyphosphate:nucleotide phosphotransferase